MKHNFTGVTRNKKSIDFLFFLNKTKKSLKIYGIHITILGNFEFINSCNLVIELNYVHT